MGPEKPVDRAIRDRVIARCGWHVKNHGSEMSRKGVPDHTIGYKGRLIMLEAKGGDGSGVVSPVQAKELRMIQAAGNIAEVCYDASLVDKIFDCIDRGEKWRNGVYV